MGGEDKQANVLKFKMEVLLDMLAVAQADEKASTTKYEQERT